MAGRVMAAADSMTVLVTGGMSLRPSMISAIVEMSWIEGKVKMGVQREGVELALLTFTLKVQEFRPMSDPQQQRTDWLAGGGAGSSPASKPDEPVQAGGDLFNSFGTISTSRQERAAQAAAKKEDEVRSPSLESPTRR